MKIPYITSQWRELFRPKETGNYINDHCVIKDNQGKYHLFGITSFLGGAPNERYFAHGVGDSLNDAFEEREKAIDRGTLAWAPCVIPKDDDFYMFYGPSPTSLAVSFDMFEWYNYPVKLNGEIPMAAHRDHFVLKLEDNKYIMYIVGTKNKKSCVSLFESSNLLEWDFCGYALTSGDDAPLNPPWGAMESPFVVKMDELYYLFITYTDCSRENYHNTLVFASDDPYSFGEYNGEKGGAMPVAKLFAHAPEILKDENGWHITTCGWNGYDDIPNPGAVSIADLEWREK